MRCANCGADFTPKLSRGRFCSAKCRKAAWQRARGADLAVVEEHLTRALVRIRRLRVGGKNCA